MRPIGQLRWPGDSRCPALPRSFPTGRCPRDPDGGSPWSRSAAPATRSTPRSSPAGSPPSGWELVDRRATTPTSSWSTPAASSRRPRRTRSTPCSPPPTSGADAWSPSAAWPSGTARSWPSALPEADAVLGFDDYADIARPARRRPRPAQPLGRARPARPAHAAADHARSQRHRGRRRPRTPPACPATPGCPAARGAARRLGRRPGRPAEARLRLRPALRVLRDPVLPRRVRLPAAGRGARRGARGWPRRASASWCWSARTPPPTARTCGDLRLLEKLLPAAGRGRRASTGCGSATCSRPRLRPGLVEVIADHARRRAVLRPVVPARQRAACCAGCAGSASTDALPRPARARSGRSPRRPASAATSSSGSPARPRTTSPSSSASSPTARLDAVGVFGYSDEDGTEAAALPGKLDAAEIAAPGRPDHRAGRGADGPAGRGPARRARRGAGRGGRRPPTGRASAGPRTRPPRSTARPRCTGAPADARSATWSGADVTGTEGVDLVAARDVGPAAAADRRGRSVSRHEPTAPPDPAADAARRRRRRGQHRRTC